MAGLTGNGNSFGLDDGGCLWVGTGRYSFIDRPLLDLLSDCRHSLSRDILESVDHPGYLSVSYYSC